jgi:hypothetical protein
MSRLTKRYRILVVVIAVQALVLLGVAALHGARLAVGTTVRVPVHAVDPLDLARGAYTNVSYDFESLRVPDGSGDVYVLLDRVDAAPGWRPTRSVADEGVLEDAADAWIRLPRTSDGDGVDTSSIESYYASAEHSQDLGSQLTTEGGYATLSLDRTGRPMLVEITSK